MLQRPAAEVGAGGAVEAAQQASGSRWTLHRRVQWASCQQSRQGCWQPVQSPPHPMEAEGPQSWRVGDFADAVLHQGMARTISWLGLWQVTSPPPPQHVLGHLMAGFIGKPSEGKTPGRVRTWQLLVSELGSWRSGVRFHHSQQRSQSRHGNRGTGGAQRWRAPSP